MKNDKNVKNRNYLSSQIRKRFHKTGLEDPDGLNKIDSGLNRIVYRISGDDYGSDVIGMVIKVQHPDSLENNIESELWEEYEDTNVAKKLVPVLDSSRNRDWILMPYGEPVPRELVDEELYQSLLDLGGTDITKDDFVYMDGNFANQRCCDYATLD